MEEHGRDLLGIDDRLEHLFEDDPRIARRRHQNTSTASWSAAARGRLRSHPGTGESGHRILAACLGDAASFR
jgi:hypothetical protein